MRSLLKSSAFFLVLAAVLYCAVRLKFVSVAQTTPSPQPLWEIDLTKFGYQGRPPIPLDPSDIWGSGTYQQGVVFTDANAIAVFFIVRDNPPGADPARKASPSDPFRLVALFFSAERGDLIKKLDWSLPVEPQYGPSALFFPATDGRFLVGIGNILSLYSSAFQPLTSYDAQQQLEVIASPAGDTFLVQSMQYSAGRWTSRFDLLDTANLSPRPSWTEPPQSDPMLWGDELAWTSHNSVFVKTPDAGPKRVIDAKKEFCGYRNFISSKAMALVECGGDEKLLVVSTDGKIIQERELGLEQVDGPIIASRDGRRFALATFEWGSGRNINPEKLTARVFALGVKEPLLTIDVPRHYGSGAHFHTGQGDTRFGWGGLSLSPDGRLLAIKAGPAVQLYKVPEAASSPACAANCPDENTGAIPPSPLPQAAPAVAPYVTRAPSALAQEVLSWLPSDTETVIAASTPFSLTDLGSEASGSSDNIGKTFQILPLALFDFKKGLFSKTFRDEKVLLAMEGSRKFRVPSGLGVGPFEGCAIAIFAGDVSARANAFLRDSATSAIRNEKVAGQNVAVFQEQMEQDVWTYFVAFPKPNIAIVATNEDYFREVLSRMNGNQGDRALPDSLPEWMHVDAQAAFWAVRHYSTATAPLDPTSPLSAHGLGNFTDNQALGLTFSFDPAKSHVATVTYLSRDPHIQQIVEKHLFPIDLEIGAREMHIRYQEVAPGVIQGSYDLDQIESAELFTFALDLLLGHAIAL